MICRTCEIEGHDSLGEKELCLVAVSARCRRQEALLREVDGAFEIMARWKISLSADKVDVVQKVRDRVHSEIT